MKQKSKISQQTQTSIALLVPQPYFFSNKKKYIKPQVITYICTIKGSFFFYSSQKPLKLIGSVSVVSNRVTNSLNQETSVSNSRTVVPQRNENFNLMAVSEVQVTTAAWPTCGAGRASDIRG